MILDNLSTHETAAVRAALAAHPQVQLHFTPTYASWLNQVELWFGRIVRDLLPRHLHVGRGLGSPDPPLHSALQRHRHCEASTSSAGS